jgi:Rrf2 family protein
MLVILASNKEVINTVELGKEMMVSPKYLRKLAGPLEKHKLIKSAQGIYGGYQLNKKPDQITLASIFLANSVQLNITNCFSPKKKCPLSKDCLTRPLWRHMEEVLQNQFYNITLQDILSNNFNK